MKEKFKFKFKHLICIILLLTLSLGIFSQITYAATGFNKPAFDGGSVFNGGDNYTPNTTKYPWTEKDVRTISFDELYGSDKTLFSYKGEVPYANKDDDFAKGFYMYKGNTIDGKERPYSNKAIDEDRDLDTSNRDPHIWAMTQSYSFISIGSFLVSGTNALYRVTNFIIGLFTSARMFNMSDILATFDKDLSFTKAIYKIFIYDTEKNQISPFMLVAIAGFIISIISLSFSAISGKGNKSFRSIINEISVFTLAAAISAMFISPDNTSTLSNAGLTLLNGITMDLVGTSTEAGTLFYYQTSPDGQSDEDIIQTQKALLNKNFIDLLIQAQFGYSPDDLYIVSSDGTSSSFGDLGKVTEALQSTFKNGSRSSMVVKTTLDASGHSVNNLGYFWWAANSGVAIKNTNGEYPFYKSGDGTDYNTGTNERMLYVIDFLSNLRALNDGDNGNKEVVKKIDNIMNNITSPKYSTAVFQTLLLVVHNFILAASLLFITIFILAGEVIVVFGSYAMIILPILLLIKQTRKFAKQLCFSYIFAYVRYVIGCAVFNVVLILVSLLCGFGTMGITISMIACFILMKFGPNIMIQINRYITQEEMRKGLQFTRGFYNASNNAMGVYTYDERKKRVDNRIVKNKDGEYVTAKDRRAERRMDMFRRISPFHRKAFLEEENKRKRRKQAEKQGREGVDTTLRIDNLNDDDSGNIKENGDEKIPKKYEDGEIKVDNDPDVLDVDDEELKRVVLDPNYKIGEDHKTDEKDKKEGDKETKENKEDGEEKGKPVTPATRDLVDLESGETKTTGGLGNSVVEDDELYEENPRKVEIERKAKGDEVNNPQSEFKEGRSLLGSEQEELEETPEELTIKEEKPIEIEKSSENASLTPEEITSAENAEQENIPEDRINYGNADEEEVHEDNSHEETVETQSDIIVDPEDFVNTENPVVDPTNPVDPIDPASSDFDIPILTDDSSHSARNSDFVDPKQFEDVKIVEDGSENTEENKEQNSNIEEHKDIHILTDGTQPTQDSVIIDTKKFEETKDENSNEKIPPIMPSIPKPDAKHPSVSVNKHLQDHSEDAAQVTQTPEKPTDAAKEENKGSNSGKGKNGSSSTVIAKPDAKHPSVSITQELIDSQKDKEDGIHKEMTEEEINQRNQKARDRFYNNLHGHNKGNNDNQSAIENSSSEKHEEKGKETIVPQVQTIQETPELKSANIKFSKIENIDINSDKFKGIDPKKIAAAAATIESIKNGKTYNLLKNRFGSMPKSALKAKKVQDAKEAAKKDKAVTEDRRGKIQGKIAEEEAKKSSIPDQHKPITPVTPPARSLQNDGKGSEPTSGDAKNPKVRGAKQLKEALSGNGERENKPQTPQSPQTPTDPKTSTVVQENKPKGKPKGKPKESDEEIKAKQEERLQHERSSVETKKAEAEERAKVEEESKHVNKKPLRKPDSTPQTPNPKFGGKDNNQEANGNSNKETITPAKESVETPAKEPVVPKQSERKPKTSSKNEQRKVEEERRRKEENAKKVTAEDLRNELLKEGKQQRKAAGKVVGKVVKTAGKGIAKGAKVGARATGEKLMDTAAAINPFAGKLNQHSQDSARAIKNEAENMRKFMVESAGNGTGDFELLKGLDAYKQKILKYTAPKDRAKREKQINEAYKQLTKDQLSVNSIAKDAAKIRKENKIKQKKADEMQKTYEQAEFISETMKQLKDFKEFQEMKESGELSNIMKLKQMKNGGDHKN